MAETTNTNIFAGNIDLSATRKKRFTIDGDENRVLELNPSDLLIVDRFQVAIPKIDVVLQDVSKLGAEPDITVVESLSKLQEYNHAMGELIDYIFDSNVCEVCVPSGSLFDIINGKLRYEYIMEAITSLYEENISREMKKIQKRVNSHTAKYTH